MMIPRKFKFDVLAFSRHYASKINTMKNSVSSYRFFLPIQTRPHDCDFYHHVNNSVYAFLMQTVINVHYARYCANLEKYKRVTAHTSNNFLSPVEFPDILLGALRVEEIGSSNLRYSFALFPPRSNYNNIIQDGEKDPILDIGIGYYGHLVESNKDPIFPKVLEHFKDSPCMTGQAVHMFLNVHDKPVENFPKDIQNAMKKLMVKSAKL